LIGDLQFVTRRMLNAPATGHAQLALWQDNPGAAERTEQQARAAAGLTPSEAAVLRDVVWRLVIANRPSSWIPITPPRRVFAGRDRHLVVSCPAFGRVELDQLPLCATEFWAEEFWAPLLSPDPPDEPIDPDPYADIDF